MATKASRSSMGMFVSCIGATALLLGVVPPLLFGPIGLLLIGGAVLSAILTVVIDLRYGASAQRSLLGVLIVGAITFGLVYGVFWYFSSFATSGKPLINFGP